MTPDEIANIAAHIMIDVEFYGHACKERAEGSKTDCTKPLHFVKVGVDTLANEAARSAGAEHEPARLRAENERLRSALDSIRQYGSDTLSGRTDGPDDRQWQRAAVLEMTNRASRALEGGE